MLCYVMLCYVMLCYVMLCYLQYITALSLCYEYQSPHPKVGMVSLLYDSTMAGGAPQIFQKSP